MAANKRALKLPATIDLEPLIPSDPRFSDLYEWVRAYVESMNADAPDAVLPFLAAKFRYNDTTFDHSTVLEQVRAVMKRYPVRRDHLEGVPAVLTDLRKGLVLLRFAVRRDRSGGQQDDRELVGVSAVANAYDGPLHMVSILVNRLDEDAAESLRTHSNPTVEQLRLALNETPAEVVARFGPAVAPPLVRQKGMGGSWLEGHAFALFEAEDNLAADKDLSLSLPFDAGSDLPLDRAQEHKAGPYRLLVLFANGRSVDIQVRKEIYLRRNPDQLAPEFSAAEAAKLLNVSDPQWQATPRGLQHSQHSVAWGLNGMAAVFDLEDRALDFTTVDYVTMREQQFRRRDDSQSAVQLPSSAQSPKSEPGVSGTATNSANRRSDLSPEIIMNPAAAAKFVSEQLRRQDTATLDELMPMYAGRVELFGKQVDRDAVRSDKRSYQDKWPVRHQKLISDVSVEEVVPGNKWLLHYVMSFAVENDAQKITGSSQDTLGVVARDGLHIYLEDGKVLTRTKEAKPKRK